MAKPAQPARPSNPAEAAGMVDYVDDRGVPQSAGVPPIVRVSAAIGLVLIFTIGGLVIFGSGARLRFPKPLLLRPLIDRRIGVETMDTAAACRTYNVLLAEGRSVVAALLFEPPV